jgi:tetratricopeptide (TPR) repeat protein
VKKKLPLTASAAVLALFAGAIASSQAEAQGAMPQSVSANGSYCLLVKNANARNYCLTAREQYIKHDHRIALATIRKAFAASPTSPDRGVIRAVSARIMMALGDVGSAEHELREARKDGAPDYVVLSALLPLMVSRHEENQLLVEFPEPAPGAQGPLAADILYGRAKAFLSLDRLAEASAAMDRSIALRRDVSGLILRAEIATLQNDKVVAAKLVDEAYKLEPKNGAAALAKLKQIQSSGDTAKTLAFSEQIFNLFPDAIEIRVIRIETFLKMKQDGKAKDEVNVLMAKSPRSSFGKYYTAILLARANDKRGAWQTMQLVPPEFVRQNPSLAIPMAQLAVENGHIDSGAAFLVNALSVAPDLLDVRLQLANLRLKQDSPQTALSILAPVQDSRDPQVQKLLATVRARIAKDRAF